MSSSSEQEDLEMPVDSSDEEVDAGIADENTDEGGESEAGESEAEESDDEDESGGQAPALDASETESDADDDDDEVDDDEDIPPPKKTANPDLRMEKIQKDVIEKYKKRQGRQLYIRFPAKLPESVEEFEEKVKSLSELIVEAHKPRQKHARFCLVSFASTEDRDKTLKKLSKNAGETKLVVSLPRTDSDEFVKTIADKKLRAIEKKRAKLLLKKENKKALKQKQFTPTIVVLNIPKSASAAQVKELFPDAVDIQTKPAPKRFNGASIATITLPSTAEARKNVKRNLSLGGTKLIIRFNNENKKIKLQKKKTEGGAKQKKGPLAPPSTGATNGNPKKKNKKNKTNGAKPAEQPEKTIAAPAAEGKTKAGKKNKANGAPVAEGPSPAKKPKQQDETKAPQKKPTKEAPLKKAKQAVEGKLPSKKGKPAGNASKFPQKQGKKPNQQNKQKKKPLK